MPLRKEPPPPATVALARQRYAEGVCVARIFRETGLSKRRVYDCFDGAFADGEGHNPPPLPRRQEPRKPTDNRAVLIARLWRNAEHQVREVDRRLRSREQEPAERERDARLMSVLVKTVRELTAIEGKTQHGEAEDEAPESIDTLRRELARKLAALGAGGAGASS